MHHEAAVFHPRNDCIFSALCSDFTPIFTGKQRKQFGKNLLNVLFKLVSLVLCITAITAFFRGSQNTLIVIKQRVVFGVCRDTKRLV